MRATTIKRNECGCLYFRKDGRSKWYRETVCNDHAPMTCICVDRFSVPFGQVLTEQ